MSRRISFSDQTLRRVARQHVSYELEMLGCLGGAGILAGADPFIGFSQLEAWLLHLRNLHEFLTTTSQQRNNKGWRNVIAADYMPPGWNPPRRCLTQAQRRRIDKALAHISADRRAGTSWDRPVLTHRVLDVFRQGFFTPWQELHPKRRQWFKVDEAEELAARSASGDFVVAQLRRSGSGWVVPV
jgi:hypothetical protein